MLVINHKNCQEISGDLFEIIGRGNLYVEILSYNPFCFVRQAFLYSLINETILISFRIRIINYS